MNEDAEIERRLLNVRAAIDEAAQKSGRPKQSVRLVAVSKTHPASRVRAAFGAGQRIFGENYAQELAQKATLLAQVPDIEWHFIGHLQRNKVKQVIAAARVVHTVDRPELATEIGRRAEAAAIDVGVLVEVNVTGEASKSGCRPDELGVVLEAIARSPRLQARGLMTMPPASEDAEAARPVFARLRELRDRHGGAAALPELSMGMSHDFEVAIEEGATLVRVGTAIFGARG